ncbi:MAG: hypothetical protein JST39_18570 [Bacteroidetes bacterium]|nr:hypothetical protein [Bacteroidota bacterium]
MQGSIGGVNFYRSQDGFLAREETSVDAERIKTDPAFKRTRENGNEFGTAAKAGKLFRITFMPLLRIGSDARVISRIVKSMMDALQFDTTHKRGKRVVSAGDLTMLKGFECNASAPLSATLKMTPTATIDRVQGKATVSLGAVVPEELIAAPTGATHFKIVTAAAAIDFDKGTHTEDFQSSVLLPWDINPMAALTLTNTLPAASTLPLFLLLGIQFFILDAGTVYPLNNNSSNALQVAAVDA